MKLGEEGFQPSAYFPIDVEVILDEMNGFINSEEVVSVIITLFNYREFILDALNDVAAQTYAPIHLVVVDDTSTDGSAEIARDWMVQHASRFVSTTLVRHRQNQGLAQSRNTAFSFAKAEHVFVLDADNGLYPRAIARLRQALADSGKAGAYSQLELFGDEAGIGFADIWSPELLAEGNYVDAMALVTKSAWRTVGGYSHMDVAGWEDFDFWCKFADAGLGCVFVPEILCRYRTHQSSMLHTHTNPRQQRLRVDIQFRHPRIAFRFP